VTRRHKTTVEGPRSKRARAEQFPTFRLLHSPERGIVDDEVVTLHVGRTLLGREVESGDGIVLADARASRVHATLHVASRSRRVRIADEDSRNGTFVNGERVEEAWLSDGDVVRVADTHFLLRVVRSDAPDADEPELLGNAPSMGELRATVAQVSPHEVNLLLIGESGSGKEVVARAIHARSNRQGPFIAVNCAAIPEQLAESQLFGHVAGAFTGARGDHPGFFRSAHGGTIFLDEIGDLELRLQPKLLRALEQRAVVPVGAAQPVPSDARIIAATHRDLGAAVEAETFRGDLYARLAELTIQVPPLRDRREDVLPLLRHAYGDPLPPLHADLVSALLCHGWPYNVRELLAVGRELRVRGGDRGKLELEIVAHRLGTPAAEPSDSDPPPGRISRSSSQDGGRISSSGSGARQTPPTREEFERILQSCKGNVRAIARETGRSRMQVYRWIEQYGLDLDEYRDK
jgi:DNA-binding NtrC family response regulator